MRNLILILLFIVSQTFSQQTNSGRILLENNIKETMQKEAPAENYLHQVKQDKKKNAGLAILYSLILPGMGELYADGYSSGKYFTIAEVSLWGAYWGVNQYANWNKDRYKSFAAALGSADVQGK